DSIRIAPHSQYAAGPSLPHYSGRDAAPPFPTRRSSDLEAIVDAELMLALPARAGEAEPDFERAEIEFQLAYHRADEIRLGFAGRSEEHTSELQSPDQLVCRLLLEKKKARTHEKIG